MIFDNFINSFVLKLEDALKMCKKLLFKLHCQHIQFASYSKLQNPSVNQFHSLHSVERITIPAIALNIPTLFSKNSKKMGPSSMRRSVHKLDKAISR